MTWQKGQSGNPAGRPKGKLNKFAMETAKEVGETGQLPADFLVSVYRDESVDIKLRVEAARSCAPYLHPRLSSSELDVKTHTSDDGQGMTDAELMLIASGGKLEASG